MYIVRTGDIVDFIFQQDADKYRNMMIDLDDCEIYSFYLKVREWNMHQRLKTNLRVKTIEELKIKCDMLGIHSQQHMYRVKIKDCIVDCNNWVRPVDAQINLDNCKFISVKTNGEVHLQTVTHQKPHYDVDIQLPRKFNGIKSIAELKIKCDMMGLTVKKSSRKIGTLKVND